MKNVVKTEIVTTRFPKELVARIEMQIEITEEYANRPDYIITAIRNYLDDFEGFLDLAGHELTKSIEKSEGTYDAVIDEERCRRIAEKNARILCDIDLWRDSYFRYKGEPTRVVVRIPTGLRKRWDRIKGCSVPIDNYLEFIRLSITKHVDRLNGDIRIAIKDFTDTGVFDNQSAFTSEEARQRKVEPGVTRLTIKSRK